LPMRMMPAVFGMASGFYYDRIRTDA
jgi:hypothetical protein